MLLHLFGEKTEFCSISVRRCPLVSLLFPVMHKLPHERRCAFMPLTLNLAWNVSQVSDLSLITACWCLMCGSRCQCGARCMCPMWMKLGFHFGMRTLCVVTAAAQCWRAAAGVRYLNTIWKNKYQKQDLLFRMSCNFGGTQICSFYRLLSSHGDTRGNQAYVTNYF